MPDHQIHWTALPRGADATEVELDVFVSPRLGTDAIEPGYKLGDFPELLSWTERVQAGEVTFEVKFEGEPPQPATIVPPENGALDEELWEHLFPAATEVHPWSFRDHSNRGIRSFPARWIIAYLRRIYKHAGAEGATLPLPATLEPILPAGDVIDNRPEEHDGWERHPVPEEAGGEGEPNGCLGAIFAPICFLLRPICRPLRRFCRWLRRLFGLGGGGAGSGKPAQDSVAYRYRPPSPRPDDPFAEVDAAIAANKVVPPYEPKGATVDAELDSYPIGNAFAQVMRFYDREEIDRGLPPEVTEAPKWEFHQRVGALGDYPELMRRLGLVIRLRVSRPAGTPASVRVAPRVGGAARPTIDVTPATACTLEGERFFATPREGSDLLRGMLDLHEIDDRLALTAPAFDLVQVDADGTAMKAIIAAASLQRAKNLNEVEIGFLDPAAEPESLPALRTAGFAVLRADRASGLKERLETMRLHSQANGSELLYADDVVRGYEVWVRPEGGEWCTLCHRDGAYRLVNEAGALVGGVRRIRDHGYVKRTGATSKDDVNSDLYLHEAVVRWSGWSLVAPLPGKAIDKTGDVAPAVSGEGKLRLETRFAPVPGSLPRLRFGGEYRFAMAWVDLAGKPLAQLAEGPDGLGDDARVSKPVEYRRFEPVAPPSLLPFGWYPPGSSLERLVVRSDYDRDPVQWLADETPKNYAWHDERRIFPPKTSQLLAERHGKFDKAIGGGAAAVAAAFDLAKREKGTFIKPAIEPWGTPDEVKKSVVNKDPDQVLVAPYLPDPLAAGALLRDVPNLTLAGGVAGDSAETEVLSVAGLERPVLRISFGDPTDWPDMKSLRIRASGQDPDAPPHWDAEERLLTISLPKAAEATVLYSCYLEPAELDKMGTWDWIDDGVEGGKLREQARSGVHWLLCPWRELTLVHAVQRPVVPAALNPDLYIARDPGETAATIAGSAEVDLASSGRVDLEATWDDVRDDVPDTKKSVVEARAVNLGNWTPTADGAVPPQRHDFGDTRHRVLRCRLNASSRFREYLPTDKELPPGKKPLDLTRQGPMRLLSVPASAPPDPPRVSYAVPSFGWQLDEGPAGAAVLGVGHTLRRRRLGGGLRVFLERPWFSSGEGERLAAVVRGPDAVPEALLSRAGIDPTVGESPTPQTRELEAAMFSGADVYESARLSEQPGRVAIASYTPVYDEVRQLWVCDVALDMGELPWGEWPFVRLALARHQHEALAGARLSKVILAQWAQLAPDRALKVTRTASGQLDVELRGRGRLVPEPNRLVAAFEVATGPDPDELDWGPPGGGDPFELDVHLWAGAKPPAVPLVEGEELVWSNTNLTLPNVGGKPLRLVVRELERRQGEGEGGLDTFRIAYADDVRLS